MTDSQEQRAFTKDLIDAGYKKFKSVKNLNLKKKIKY